MHLFLVTNRFLSDFPPMKVTDFSSCRALVNLRKTLLMERQNQSVVYFEKETTFRQV